MDPLNIPPLLPNPTQTPGIIVVIPCYKEPYLLHTLEALHHCHPPTCFSEVIIVINHPENATREARQQNEQTLYEVQEWIKNHRSNHLDFHIIYKPDIPVKIAGVGAARKTGMDEAARRFAITNHDGVIVGFDADSTCDDNYLTEIEQTFNHPKINGASIYFEHPLNKDEGVYEGVMLYELHLRYLNKALRYAGFPYAFHTVGSAFAVRASVYIKQGGMNQRKAGEDFHFLHKIIPLGGFVEINQTRVIPSPRTSDRVPFGTGASMSRWVSNGEEALFTYPLEPFIDLKNLFALVPHFWETDDIELLCSHLSHPLQSYLDQNNYSLNIRQAKTNSASLESFHKRFFAWFNGLKTVQYLNYSCLNHYNKQSAEKAASVLLETMGYPVDSIETLSLLTTYRNIDRNVTSTGNH